MKECSCERCEEEAAAEMTCEDWPKAPCCSWRSRRQKSGEMKSNMGRRAEWGGGGFHFLVSHYSTLLLIRNK